MLSIIDAIKLAIGIGGNQNEEKPSLRSKSAVDFLIEEIRESPYIRDDAKPTIEISVGMTDSKAQLLRPEDLSSEGALIGHKKTQKILRLRAKHRYFRAESISRISDAGYSLFTLSASNDERDCAWCKANDKQTFSIGTDIDKLIKDNCRCEYCRCAVIAKRVNRSKNNRP